MSPKGRIPPIMSRLPPGEPKILSMYSGIPAGKGSMPKRGPRIAPRLWVKSVSIEISFVYAFDEPFLSKKLPPYRRHRKYRLYGEGHLETIF
jgi:hypothetical protein